MKEQKEIVEEGAVSENEESGMPGAQEQRLDKKRERRRFRKRRGRGESDEETSDTQEETFAEETTTEIQPSQEPPASKPREERAALIPPPTTLISETLSRYKETPGYASAFYEKKEEHIENGESHEDSQKKLLLEEPVEPHFFEDERVEEEPSIEDEERF